MRKDRGLTWFWNLTKTVTRAETKPNTKLTDQGSATGQGSPAKSTPSPAPFFPSEHFLAYLKELSDVLQPGASVALTGMPGVGKTYLAREYKKRSDAKVVWVSAGKEKSTEEAENSAGEAENVDVNEILRRIALVAAGYLENDVAYEEYSLSFSNKTDINAEVKDVLKAFVRVLDQTKDWLLVFDNLDGFFNNPGAFDAIQKSCFPQPHGGRILITTRDRADDIIDRGMHPIEIEPMNQKEGTRFLLGRVGLSTNHPTHQTDAKRICKQVGGLPLALDQAAAYIRLQVRETNGTYTLRQYEGEYGKIKSDLRKHKGGMSHKPVYHTFMSSPKSGVTSLAESLFA
jgi:hypothetical protein